MSMLAMDGLPGYVDFGVCGVDLGRRLSENTENDGLHTNEGER
jgi:hypothetical protein